MASESVEQFRQSLAAYVDALEAAREAVTADLDSAASVRRMAERLESASGRHGFRSVQIAARAVQMSEGKEVLGAVDQLLYALLNAVSVDEARDATVLIVEDDAVFSRLLQKVLARRGRHLEIAERASDMLKVFRTRWVDLIVLDIGLPDMDGREVLTALRKNPITEKIPVLVLSARDEPWVAAECLALGADGFMSKPVDPVALDAVVSGLLAPPPKEPAAAPDDARLGVPLIPGPEHPLNREVLLAEHDPLTSQIIRHRLGREGYQVRHFTSGTAALQAAKSLTPSVVILDAMTPGIDGIELLVRLRELPHYRTTPMLVLSDIGSEREVVRALEAGADDCIRKPFSPTELLARVERLLKRS